MKKIIIPYLISGITAFLLFCPLVIQAQHPPLSRELLEAGEEQRRDMSMPGSRLVVNFYDFNGKQTAVEYSNGPSVPLHIAYLSTEKNEPGKSPKTRFSRAVKDLLMVGRSFEPFRQAIMDAPEKEVKTFHTRWMPHALPFQVIYNDCAEIDGTDFFYDENTLVRTLTFRRNTKGYFFFGNYHGKAYWQDSIIRIENNQLQYAIRFSLPVSEWAITESTWHIKPAENILSEKKELTITVAFVGKEEPADMLQERVEAPGKKNNISQVLTEREAYWNDFLSKVPCPPHFGLHAVDTYGVTAEEIRSAYYKAWVFTAQNLLPEDPVRFPYPQFCTGKPSLWDEGEERAPFSAAWESFIGMQLYAFIDSDISWEAFKGLMSLVDENGMLGGESLPSRKAQTALFLYRMTKDRNSLAEVYPALERYLNWRIKITHWVYMDMLPDENTKDAEFAFSALVDMEYMAEIAGILGLEDDKRLWKEKHRVLRTACLQWFWETPDSHPVQYYNLSSGFRNNGNAIWVTTGLYVDSLLHGKYKESMLALFNRFYNLDLPFAGFDIPKYPDVSYTVYGLMKNNRHKEATGLLEANIRDIVRAGSSFAEQYIGEGLEPDGVRPSLFGSSTLIDFVLLMNGYRYDTGLPVTFMAPFTRQENK
ncbi:MAG: hypothetical protein LUG18_06905 [Candidatus Azobacteroides sp.]|nr:hypothetical protein [Candidatus Azobacteroides sp.]